MRYKLDSYYTHQKLVEQLLVKYPINNRLLLEPCTGTNHITTYLKEVGYSVITNDIDKNMKADFNYDATLPILWNTIDLIKQYTVITNPPFNVATKILEQALSNVDEVCMLLRLSFLEPTADRKELMNRYKDNLVKVIVINPRPQFRSDSKSTDSVTVAWFIWNKKFSWNKLNIAYPFDFINDWK